MEVLLLDTGPLVALFEQNEAHHRWAVKAMARRARLLTCEAVITETCFLLGRGSGAPALNAFLDFLREGALEVPSVGAELGAIGRLMRSYAKVPMSFADACLVRLVEQHPHARVMTLDTDFTIYRYLGRRVIDVLMPD